MLRHCVLAWFISLLLAGPACAWLRVPHEDAQVVERSELIVVGRLKRDSITRVPHARGPNEGRSWEHHADLIVAQVLKGAPQPGRIPIIIHYGLDPVVPGRKDNPKGIIGIVDSGSSGVGGPMVKDAAKDALWFLRRRSGRFGRKPGTGKFGIVDPEDLQPLELKDYFLAYLSPDPEAAVRKFLGKSPELDRRIGRFLDHLEVGRIIELPNTGDRIAKLLPFYLKRQRWALKSEARDGLVACGRAAGPPLRAVFDDPKHEALRTDIILIWGSIRYDGCVPLLTGLLEKHDAFWAAQKLEKGWWNTAVSSEVTRRRRQVYGEVYYGVCTLRKLGAARARAAIELTKRRWDAIGFSNPQIVEECTRALKELPSER